MPKRVTAEQFIEKAKIVHDGKYNYSKVIFTGMQNEVIIICPEHGEFVQKPAVHINDRCGCPTCGYADRRHPHKKTTEQFIVDAQKVHGDGTYDYSLVDYKNSSTDIQIICLIHGIFNQRPEAHVNQKQGCRDCGYLTRELPQQKITIQFIAEAEQKLGKTYDYSITTYKNKDTKIEQKAFVVRNY